MGYPISFSLVLFCLSIVLSLVNDGNAAADDRKLMASEELTVHDDFHIIKLSSILPDQSVCDSSSSFQGHKLSSSGLRVVHKHGPCHKSTNSSSSTSPPSISHILTQDTSRVNSINSRIASNSAKNTTTFGSSELTTLPAKSGLSLGSANYIVTVGLGTPKKDLSLIFDTGSDLTWTQCQPCAGTCYSQREPIFDPSQSSQYVNVPCDTAPCNQLKDKLGCRGNNCIYEIRYVDGSITAGYFAKDTLTISPTEIIADFYFGCGQQNEGLFGQIAGLIGLGRDPVSIVSQTKAKYGQVFSYCLPSRSSGIGYLNFGKTAVSNAAVQYIPFSSSQDTTFYYIDITEIYVGNRKLPISPTVFSTSGSIIDSGTVITRLPPAAYTSLRDTFKEMMSMYPLGEPDSLFDTCYDLSRYTAVKLPTISFVIGGKRIDIDDSGVMYAASSSQICLGFAPNSKASQVTTLGNVQQRRMQVVYDVAGGKIGFGSNGCA